MKARLLVFPALLLPGLLSCAATNSLADKAYASIRKYYTDCGYVADNSTHAETARIVGMLRGAQKPQFGPLDIKGRKVYDAILATQGVILHPDPGIFGLMFPIVEYDDRTTPVEIVRSGDGFVSIRVTREVSRLSWDLQRSVGTTGNVFPRGDRPMMISAIDDWLLINGKWRLKAVHTILT